MLRPILITSHRYTCSVIPCRSIPSCVKIITRQQHDQWISTNNRHHHLYQGYKAIKPYQSIWTTKHSSQKSSSIQLQNTPNSTNNNKDLDPIKSIGYRFPDWTVSHTAKDTILYALGVGVSRTQPDYLKFLFEKRNDFSVLPTFAVIPAQKVVLALIYGKIPGFENIDFAKALHGEQYLEVYEAIPSTATLRNKGVVIDVMDKRSGALLLIDVRTYNDHDDKLLAYNQFSLFVGGGGGFGGKRSSDHTKPTVKSPSSSPDISVTQTTSIDQAALYRLSGDNNPLHIDPETAKRGGFPRSITHGLCTFGFAFRHVLQQYADNDVTKVKQVKVRFSKPVFPGQTIQTDMWREGDRIYFQCKVTDTGDIVISGAYVELCDIT